MGLLPICVPQIGHGNDVEFDSTKGTPDELHTSALSDIVSQKRRLTTTI